MTKHNFKVLALIVVLASSFFILFEMMGKKTEKEKIPTSLVNFNAPKFRALKLHKGKDSQYVELSQYKGKPLVLSFWASWCSVCREEGMYLKLKKSRLEESGEIGGARFLRIAVSDSYENVRNYWDSDQNPLETAFDKSGLIAVDYGLTGVPETFFINPEGVIVYRHRGPLTEEIFDTYFEEITEENEAFVSEF